MTSKYTIDYPKYKKNIILMGMKHCGKSTLGKMLAADTGWDFFDIDYLTEEEYNHDHLNTIREIYKVEGPVKFRSLEAMSSCLLSKKIKDDGGAVIAFGGATIENEIAMGCIAGFCLLVYLQETPGVLFKRIMADGRPPFLSSGHPYQDFVVLYEQRIKTFEMHADVKINIHNKNIAASLAAIKTTLKELGYAW